MRLKHLITGTVFIALAGSISAADTTQALKQKNAETQGVEITTQQKTSTPAVQVQASTAPDTTQKLVPQKTCPVMGGPVNKKIYIDYNGKRMYACCPGCLGEMKSTPEKYIKIIEKRGEKVGEIKQDK